MDFDNYLGKEIPKLGFGLMRLPQKDKAIDIEQFKQMTDEFLDAGFTYFDTAYGYEGSEAATKIALVDRHPRASFQLATKLPAWRAETKSQAEEMFYTSLERTGAEYFDFYLLHNLGDKRTEAFSRFDVWEFLAKRKQEGLIRHLGLSSHAKADELDTVLREHPEMEFVQLQLNYADWESGSIQCRANYEVATAHNMPVIAMEPVKGGSLASLPEPAAALLLAANSNDSQASWALRYTASLDGLITVLSGMSDLAQLRENIATFKDFKPLSPTERDVIETVRVQLDKQPNIPCTFCEYCLDGCPENIAIPGIFEAFNLVLRYGETRELSASFEYAWQTVMSDRGKASACIECGACQDACPQGIAIIEELKCASELFDTKPDVLSR